MIARKLRGATHELERRGALELLFVPPEEAGRKRLRLPTDCGTDCAINLAREEQLTDGALLYIDDERAGPSGSADLRGVPYPPAMGR